LKNCLNKLSGIDIRNQRNSNARLRHCPRDNMVTSQRNPTILGLYS
jgi:hypothetical protein